MTTQTTNNRKNWIDNLKGICLILIIIGHFVTIPDSIRYIIKPTDLLYVPIFFYLSGLLFNDDRFTYLEFLKRKLYSLAIPYFTISLVVTLLDWNLYINTVQLIKSTLLSLFWGDGAIKASPLWFVSTLFCGNILLKTGFLVKDIWMRHLLFLSFPFICYALYANNCRLPFCLDKAFGAAFLMYSAYILKNINQWSQIIRTSILILSFFLTIIGCYYHLGLLNYQTLHSWMSFPAAIGGCLLLSEVSYKLLQQKLPPPYLGCKKRIAYIRISLSYCILP